MFKQIQPVHVGRFTTALDGNGRWSCSRAAYYGPLGVGAANEGAGSEPEETISSRS